ncbi:hypothetical protein llap_1122 [Limosa lapponica baueri]|uniref:Uncharacterized protein n=1 Tax=Limosa lapponica baueri TaxID=1758121 RepID=A0A2I0URD1_LIMLA|nr:hypothetical protein llap_1122 [Limosa lapponica baueri]
MGIKGRQTDTVLLIEEEPLKRSQSKLFDSLAFILNMADGMEYPLVQDAVGFLGCKHTLTAHVELLIHQHPQVLLLRDALNPFSAQPVVVLGIAVTQAQDLALGLLELHEIRTGPPLKPVQVPLDSIPSLQHVGHATQPGVVSKLAEDSLNPTAHVASKDVEQHWSQYLPLRNPKHHWFALGHRAVDDNPLSMAI